MRQSSVYSFKRLSMKMQYEILRLGLEASMLALANQMNHQDQQKA